jgi:hypothetical protein
MSEWVREALKERIHVVAKGEDLETISKNHKERCIAEIKEENPEIEDKNIWVSDIEFKKEIQDGDEIWYFETDKESWQKLCGRMGYALVRLQMVIDYKISIMN